MLKFRIACCIFLTAFLAVPGLLGQGADMGAIQGTVTDKSGAVVPGVTLTIKNLATAFERVVVSESSGGYRFPGLGPGAYSLKAELAGFTTYEVKSVTVNVGRTTDVNVTLEPAGTAETITVSEIAPLVEATKTDVGGVVDNREVTNLPLNGRNFSSLATLIPGARPVTGWDPTKNRMGAVSLAGAGGRNINTTIDGIDNKDNTVGGYVQNITLEGVKEFALKTQRFSAADGRSQGGLLSIVTKSGSNSFHGSWFSFFRDRSLNKNDYINQHQNAAKPDFSRKQFGGSIGGPIKKDRAFFFFTYERLQEDSSLPVDPNVTSELQLLKTNNVNIYGAVPVVSSQIPTPFTAKLWMARMDFLINAKNNVYMSWNENRDRTENDQGGIVDMSSSNFNANMNELASIVLSSTLSSKMVNQLVLGYSYWHNLIDQNPRTAATINFAGPITFGTNANVPQESYQRKWQFKDSLSWNRGNHALKFGVDYIYEPIVGGILGFSDHPNITFFDNPSIILSNKATYPQGFATPGIVSAVTANSGSPYFDFTGNQFAWYVQDDWRVSRKLSLNLGLRYDADLGLLGADRQAQNRTYLILKQINSPWASHLPEDNKTNFAPRFGFAYDPAGEGKTVLRGGYGIYFDQVFINVPLFAQQQTYAMVFAQTTSLTNSSIGDPSGNLPTFRIGDPIPLSPASPDIAVGALGRLIDPNYQSPMSQQWNIGFSQQFSNDFVLEADYTHMLNTHESRRVRANPKIVVGNANPRLLESAFVAAGLPANRLADIIVESSVNRSRYDGFNIGLRKRLSHRTTFQTSYTLSKAQGYGGTSGEFAATARYNQFNYLDPRELAPTMRDERHRFTFSGVIDLPWGFQVSPILQLASARPYTLNAGTDVNRDGVNPSGTAANIQGADPCAPGTLAPNGRACPQNAGINSQRGGYDLDGNWQSGRFFLLDMRASKYINLGRVREGMGIGFFFETFNLTNRVNFGNRFTPSVRSGTFMTTAGLATTTYGLTAAAPFQAQLGFRFTF